VTLPTPIRDPLEAPEDEPTPAGYHSQVRRRFTVTLLGPSATFAVLALAPPAALVPSASAAPTEPGDLANPLESAANCQTCHRFTNPVERADEPMIAPWAWRGSMMGNTARDPVFWAGVAVASQDEPAETPLCVRCHSPQAFLDGRGDAIAQEDLEFKDLFGVDCESCHRAIDDGETPAGNANYVIDDVAVDGQVPKRGPWSYEAPTTPPHPTTDDNAFVSSSRLCGTCHEVTTPRERLDDDGQQMGMLFNEQRTYSEWLASDFAGGGADHQDCQDCHMPAVADVAGCDSFSIGGFTHATGGRRHDLSGANQRTIEVLKSLYGSEGANDTPDLFFDEAIARSQELMETAATLDIGFPDLLDLEQGFTLPVTITNESGHKLPTGYSEGRIMWVEVTVRYADQVLYSSGLWDTDALSIEDDAQLRSYEAIAERWSDGSRFHLLHNDYWVVDDRIPARGMAPDPQTDPVGDRYQVVDGAWQHWDDFEYQFDATSVDDVTPESDDDDTALVSVRVLYLINSQEYLDFLADENGTNEAGTTVQAAFDALGGPAPVVVVQDSVEIPLRGLQGQDGPGETDTGSTDGQTDDTEPTGSDTGESTPQDDEGDGGCGCTQASSAPLGWLSLFLPLLALRRRKHQPGANR
jgi:hypothetical protein